MSAYRLMSTIITICLLLAVVAVCIGLLSTANIFSNGAIAHATQTSACYDAVLRNGTIQAICH